MKKYGEKGIDGDVYYGYQDNLKMVVENNFKKILGVEDLIECKTELIKGLFEETMYINEKVALAHIDCDWYDSVYVCLDRIVPNLVSGGVLIIDDYYAWSGCMKAVDDYMSDKKDGFYFLHSSRLHIIKKGLLGDTMLLEEAFRASQKSYEVIRELKEQYKELKKWCDELQEGKNWIEEEFIKLKAWCDELQQGKNWLEKQLNEKMD